MRRSNKKLLQLKDLAKKECDTRVSQVIVLLKKRALTPQTPRLALTRIHRAASLPLELLAENSLLEVFRNS